MNPRLPLATAAPAEPLSGQPVLQGRRIESDRELKTTLALVSIKIVVVRARHFCLAAIILLERAAIKVLKMRAHDGGACFAGRAEARDIGIAVVLSRQSLTHRMRQAQPAASSMSTGAEDQQLEIFRAFDGVRLPGKRRCCGQ